MYARKKTKLAWGGGVNDAPYQVYDRVDGKQVVRPYYRVWLCMLKRCHSPSFQAKNPTYRGCTVAPEWLCFMAFRSWMEGQDWESKAIDKDLLVPGNRVYSPETCVFVDQATNKLLTDSAAVRGELPLGVDLSRGRHQARCRTNGKQQYLGLFSTPAEAHAAWQEFKAKVIRAAADRQPDPRVRAALHGRADFLDRDRLAGHETLDLKGNARPLPSKVQQLHVAPGRAWTQQGLFA